MIRWLHIADLHMKNKNDADQQNFFNALLKDCAEQRIKADFIIAPGDFHNFWDVESYTVSQAFLHKLMEALNLDIQKDLFMVPGNHDVDGEGIKHADNVQTFLSYAKLDASERLHLEEPADQDFDYARVLNKHSELSQKLLKDFESYCKMAGTLIQAYQEGTDGYLNPACVHVRIWNNRFNILHLNTAILSDGKRGHAEAADIDKACSSQLRDELNSGLPTIVLGHHSFHDLHPTIKMRLVQLFNQTNVWAYLAGDRHRTNYKGDEYLIDRKLGVNAWPNIIVGKMAATIDDNYSEFGVALYCWDEHSTVTVQYLSWDPKDSGNGLICSAGRPFPMRSDVNSQLYYDLLDRLIKMRDNHPSFQLMKIDERVIPKANFLEDCMVLGGRSNDSQGARPLSEIFLESWSRKTQNHLALVGEGGIGKTVALLSLTTKEGFLPRHVPAVYIPLHALKSNHTDDSIGKYLLEETLDGDTQQYIELLKMARREWEDGPRLILLLDGFNEIHWDVRFIVMRNIEEWSNKQGVQIIITSRFDIHCIFSGLSGELTALKLQPLSRQQIQDHLRQANTLPPSSNSALWTIIDYPLMLALYVQAEALQKKNSLIPLDWLEQKNAGTIVWNYLQRELWNCQCHEKDPGAPIQYVLATEIIAPYLAWKMVENGQFLVPENDFSLHLTKILTHLKTADLKTWPEHVQKVIRLCGGMGSLPDADAFSRLLTDQLSLFCRRDSNYGPVVSLMHQRFRDCLAAVHLLNLAQSISDGDTLPDEWQRPIDYYVMNFLVELLRPGSEAAEKLWAANRALQPTSRDATINLLELYKRYRQYDFSELDFSYMDLRKIHLNSYHRPGETHLQLPVRRDKMYKTILSQETFEPEGHTDIITKIIVTPDNLRFISASFDATIRIWDINTGRSLHVLDDHASSINDIVLTADGRFCISASDDHTLRIWDINTGKCKHVLEEHTDKVQAVAICSDGHTCANASKDGTIRLWRTEDGHNILFPIPIFEHEQIRYIDNVQAADNYYFVCVSEEEHVRIWNVSERNFLPPLKGLFFDTMHLRYQSTNHSSGTKFPRLTFVYRGVS